ncbi:hypothetical protein [Candidatus Nitrosotalea okcheonensis]|uniref:Response regulatory domain-containing protein n=1 Tax=Candidatus Nitrosotalea okcheonensis TaxID=1903276 RepID=A0A2H1FIJ9_9ARCH|nr:hypothetical protein [Candidatus Nitrosotalea okcheonensis]SMH72596.1 protein of unknown function [Candidatus Nitrosotalea okcheonensis]
MNEIVVVYIEDQDEMIMGATSFFSTTEFKIVFIKNIEGLDDAIMNNSPKIVISDDDINGKKYATDIAEIVSSHRKFKKIILIGCSAYANAPGLEKEYQKVGFDRFFDNDGSEEHMNIIVEYMREQLKKNKM